MKKLKYLLFILLFLFIPNVFATTINPDYYNITASNGGTRNRYIGYSASGDVGSDSVYSLNTRYNGTLSAIEFYLHYAAVANYPITLTLNMATSDWRNNFYSVNVTQIGSGQTGPVSVSKITYVSMRKIYFSFTPTMDGTDYKIQINSPSLSSPFTGVSNWNLLSIELNDHYYDTPSSGSGGSGSTDNTNSDIINNNNTNTQNVINNDNNNTNNIIENNNNNTQQIIDNQQQLLGNCITNVMTGSDIISLDNLYSSGNNFQQITADTNTTLSLSLQAYNNGSYLYNLGDTQYITDTKTYTIRFTKTSDFNAIKFKLNGLERDTGLMINVSSLKDDYIYYISADFFKLTQGDIRFNRLIIKENPSFGFVPWGETVCFSKLDDVNNNINGATGAITGAVQGGVSDVINNQNQNTNKTIDSQKVCKDISYSYNSSNFNTLPTSGYLQSDGSILSDSLYGTTDYIPINSNTNYNVNFSASSSGWYYCLYNSSKSLVSCYQMSSSFTININYNGFARFSTRSSYTLSINSNVCQNGNQAITDTLTDTNNFLKDDSEPTISDSALNDVFGRVHFNDPLSYLLTLPTQLINKIVSLSDTCSPIDLGTLYGVHLTLPCINLENYLGSDLWTILDIILSVGLLSVILKNFYDTISNLLTLGGEKEAKEKFSMPTPMDFLAMILGGDRQ